MEFPCFLKVQNTKYWLAWLLLKIGTKTKWKIKTETKQIQLKKVLSWKKIEIVVRQFSEKCFGSWLNESQWQIIHVVRTRGKGKQQKVDVKI